MLQIITRVSQQIGSFSAINTILVIGALFFTFSCETRSLAPDAGNPDLGTGGSLARFTIDCDHLYAVDETSLKVIGITDPANPIIKSSLDLGIGIETIFPYDDYLFIGSNTGMHIYNLKDCSNPAFESRYEHVFGCDPVVVEGNLAYVTVRNGTSCRNTFTANLLEIIDVSDKSNPRGIASHNVDEPWGLGIEEETLFLCHGSEGFGIYDVSNPQILDEQYLFPNIEAFDVIPYNSNIMIIARDGLYQYDYSTPGSPILLSKIPING